MIEVQSVTHVYYIVAGGIALGILLWWNDTK